MKPRAARIGGVTLSCAATMLWLVDLGWWEASAEPAKPWGDYSAENNTYWARDLRWSMIAAALVGLVWAVRGDRRRSIGVAILGPVWLVADALLDRANVGPAFAWTAMAVVVVASAVAIAYPQRGPVPETGRRPLVMAAFIAASLAPLTMSMESITDDQRSLAIGSGLAATLLVAGALGAAVTAGPALTWRRWTALAAVSAVAVALVVAGRIVEPWDDRNPGTLVALFLVALLLISVRSLGSEWPENGLRRLLVAVPLLTVGYFAVFIAVVVLTGFSAPVGQLFTGMAGNPAVNSSDTDAISSFLGFVTGAVFAWMYELAHKYRWRQGLASGLRVDPRAPAS